MEILYVVLYLAFSFLLWIQLYGFLYRWHMKEYDGILDWGTHERLFAVVWGGTVCLFWPFSIPVFVVGFVFIRGGLALLRTRPVVNLLKKMEK